jgi:hypothetical protein
MINNFTLRIYSNEGTLMKILKLRDLCDDLKYVDLQKCYFTIDGLIRFKKKFNTILYLTLINERVFYPVLKWLLFMNYSKKIVNETWNINKINSDCCFLFNKFLKQSGNTKYYKYNYKYKNGLDIKKSKVIKFLKCKGFKFKHRYLKGYSKN